MDRVIWGVWFEGSSVIVVADGLSAFRVEAAMRACGYDDAVAVWSGGGVTWWPVSRGSRLRPDPRPPAQARGWREALARVGRNRLRFSRRRL
jgi:hypothetical protein